MQAAKLLLTLLAVGFCAGPVFSQTRPDTEAQAKAREALRKKIAELEGQAVEVAPAAGSQPATAPVAPASAFAAPPATSPGAAKATPEQTERLREAVRQKIAELKAQAEAAPPEKSAAELRAEEKAAAAERRAQEKAAAAEERRLVEAAQAQERAAAAEAEKALAAKPGVKPPPKAAKLPPSIVWDPLPAPPSSIPASKQERLTELLGKYKADEITPEQYHTERAKILAEP